MTEKENIRKTSQDFVIEIDNLVAEKKMSYIDAIVHYSETNNIEIEVVAALVKQQPQLKSKVYSKCLELNLVKGNAKLF